MKKFLLLASLLSCDVMTAEIVVASGGKLTVRGKATTNQVVVENNGRLAGDGEITAQVQVQSGGNLDPSPNQATLAIVGDLSLAGTFQCDTGSVVDSLNVSGNLDLTGATLSFNQIDINFPSVHIISDSTTLTTPPFNSVLGLPAAYRVVYDYAPGGGTTQIAIVASNSYELWIANFLPLENDQTLVGPLANFDGDRINNLFTFLLGGDPTSPDISILPTLTAGASTSLSLPWNQAASSLNPFVEMSADLQTWNQVIDGVNGASILVTPNFYAPGTDKLDITLPSSSTSFFYRLGSDEPN